MLTSRIRAQGASVVTTLPAEVARRWPWPSTVRLRSSHQAVAYDPCADVAGLAAAYLVGFGRTQGFADGNKKAGLACAADDAAVAAYLRERLSAGQ